MDRIYIFSQMLMCASIQNSVFRCFCLISLFRSFFRIAGRKAPVLSRKENKRCGNALFVHTMMMNLSFLHHKDSFVEIPQMCRSDLSVHRNHYFALIALLSVPRGRGQVYRSNRFVFVSVCRKEDYPSDKRKTIHRTKSCNSTSWKFTRNDWALAHNGHSN